MPAALLLRNGIPVVSQRDFRTLLRLFDRVELPRPDSLAPRDHHETAWHTDYFQVHDEGGEDAH